MGLQTMYRNDVPSLESSLNSETLFVMCPHPGICDAYDDDVDYVNLDDDDGDDDDDDDDIYIMMKCLSVCYVFAYFAFPLPSCRYIYNDEVCVCMSRFFCLFCLPPAKLTIYI